MGNKKESNIGKTVRDFNVGFKSQMKQHYRNLEKVNPHLKFSRHVFSCVKYGKNDCHFFLSDSIYFTFI